MAIAGAPVAPLIPRGMILELDVELIDVADNVRVDPGELEGLAASIKAEGLAQPVKAIGPHADGRYRLVYGQRRLLATRLAGLSTIATIVEASSEADEPGPRRAIVQLVENLQRADLNPIDEARALHGVLEADPSLTQQMLAEKLGRSQSWIANSLRLLDVAPAVQTAIAAGEISAAHGKALASVPTNDQVEFLAIARDNSAHELERQIKWRREQQEREAQDRERASAAAQEATAKLIELGAARGDTVHANAYGDTSTLQKWVQAQGWKFSTKQSWPKTKDCDCAKVWRVETDWQGRITKAGAACIVLAHARAKEDAAEARRKERADRNTKLRAALREQLKARITPDVVAPTAARFAVWAMLGAYYREEFAKRALPGEKKPDAWAALVAASDDVVFAKLVELLVAATASWQDDAPLEAMLRSLTAGAGPSPTSTPAPKKSRLQARQDRINAEVATTIEDRGTDAPMCSCGKPKVDAGGGRWVCTNPDHKPADA